MSLNVLKRKALERKTFKGINGTVNAPSSSSNLRNVKNTRANSKNFYIVPDTSSGEKISKIKSTTLHAEDNCNINITINPRPDDCKKPCTVHKDLSTKTSSDYLERKKQTCSQIVEKQRIRPTCGY